MWNDGRLFVTRQGWPACDQELTTPAATTSQIQGLDGTNRPTGNRIINSQKAASRESTGLHVRISRISSTIHLAMYMQPFVRPPPAGSPSRAPYLRLALPPARRPPTHLPTRSSARPPVRRPSLPPARPPPTLPPDRSTSLPSARRPPFRRPSRPPVRAIDRPPVRPPARPFVRPPSTRPLCSPFRRACRRQAMPTVDVMQWRRWKPSNSDNNNIMLE